MGVRSKRHRSWEDIISLTNPDKGYPTCVGYAKTCHRRCQRVVSAQRVAAAAATVAKIKGLGSKTSSRLRRVADDMLCWQHDHQVEDVSSSWMEEGEEAFGGSYEYDWDALYDEMERLRRLFEEYEAQQRSYTKHKSRTRHSQSRTGPNKEEEHKYKPESFTADQGKEQPRAKEDKKTTPSPSDTKYKRSERQEWDDTWDKYIGKWASLDADPENKDVKIPWPTRSGKLGDVNEANIRQFFRQGPQAQSMSGEERFRMMNIENKRWHTDKIMSRFGREVMVGEHKDALNTISRVVIELWKEAKARRCKI